MNERKSRKNLRVVYIDYSIHALITEYDMRTKTGLDYRNYKLETLTKDQRIDRRCHIVKRFILASFGCDAAWPV